MKNPDSINEVAAIMEPGKPDHMETTMGTTAVRITGTATIPEILDDKTYVAIDVPIRAYTVIETAP